MEQSSSVDKILDVCTNIAYKILLVAGSAAATAIYIKAKLD